MSEEINVIFHAVSLGRTDVVNTAISSLRQSSATSVPRLISSGRATDGVTPLHLAVEVGNPDVIRALLNAGADVTAESHAGARPYELAVQESSRTAFHVFLYEAVAIGKIGAIEQLLAGGIPTSVVLVDGSPLLCVAASFSRDGNCEITQFLLRLGCEVDAPNLEGQTALHLACKDANAALVKILLDEGAASDLLDLAGRAPKDLLPKPAGPAVAAAVAAAQAGAVQACLALLLSPPVPTFPCGTAWRLSVEEAVRGATGASPGADTSSLAAAAAGSSSPSGTLVLGGLGSPSLDSAQSGGASRSSTRRNSDARLGSSAPGHASSARWGEWEEEEDEDGDDPDAVKLVLWPPPQRQRRRSHASFSLHSQEIVTICAESALLDCVTLLVDALLTLGLQCEVMPAAAGGVVRMSLDRNICPGLNRYELSVMQHSIALVASDLLGMRYGVQCLLQILKLHSQTVPAAPLHAPPPAGLFGVASGSDASMLYIPSISISDWPDVENRVCLWSCRSVSECNLPELRSLVALMSDCRLNMLFLAIDPAPYEPPSTLPRAEAGPDAASAAAAADAVPWTAISDLQEHCTKVHIQLIPTLVFTSIHQAFPTQVLELFSHQMVQIAFLLQARGVGEDLLAEQEQRQEEEEAEEKDEGGKGKGGPGGSPRPERVLTSLDVERAARSFCASILAQAKEAGFTTVLLGASSWARAAADPQDMAHRCGLECLERPISLLFPSIHFVKPLIASQDFVRAVAQSAYRSMAHTNSLSVMPAFVDSEFMVPALLLKYYLLLHAGFSWNYATSMDILWIAEGPAEAAIEAEEGGEGAGRFDASIIRDVVSVLLFRQQSDDVSPAQAAALSLFTGELYAEPNEGAPDSLSPASTVGTTPTHPLSAHSPGLRAISSHIPHTDTLLWSVLTSPAAVDDIPVPSKEDAALCLKYYKRLLNLARWNAHTAPGAASGPFAAASWLWGASTDTPLPSLEVEELLCVAHLMSVLAKAVVLAHGTHEKAEKAGPSTAGLGAPGPLRLGAILRLLPPGLNSDIANSLLEALDRCVAVWRRRFRSLAILQGGAGTTAAGRALGWPGQAVGSGSPTPSALRMVPFQQARARFFRSQVHGIPAMAFLGTRGGVREKLPSPVVVDETLRRLFS